MSDKRRGLDPVCSRAELVARAPEILGVRPEVAAGALHGAPGELTVAEARRLVKRFLRRRI
ncbi:MAG: hypothetical protein AB1816_18220 [Bacillota bacterium]